MSILDKKILLDELDIELKKALDNGFLEPDLSGIEVVSKKLLKYLGYKVVEPIKFDVGVGTIDGMVEYFYIMLDNHYPKMMGRRNVISMDRRIAKLFVESRIATGVSKKVALSQCAHIIYTVFKHEAEFNFNTPLHFGMFGQDKMGWVTKRALEIIEKQRLEEEASKLEAFREMYDEYKNNEDEELGLNLDEVINKMGVNN